MSKIPVNFKEAVLKTLSAVEAHPDKSNQHEFNGVRALKKIFGLDKFKRIAEFSVRGTPINCSASVTWYDARELSIDRTEHRLYFAENIVMREAREGDNIIFGVDYSDVLHCVLIKNGNPTHSGFIADWTIPEIKDL